MVDVIMKRKHGGGGASVGIPLVKPARNQRRNFQFDTEFDYREHFEICS